MAVSPKNCKSLQNEMMTKEANAYFVYGNSNNPAGIFKKSAAKYKKLRSSVKRFSGETVSTSDAGD